jgi:uncharacterized DUF497 family protein
MEFEWDETKNQVNIAKHGISFLGAAHIFDGPTLEFVDERYGYGETRVAAIGAIGEADLLVIYTMRGDVCRIISARRARRNERRAYRQIFPR